MADPLLIRCPACGATVDRRTGGLMQAAPAQQSYPAPAYPAQQPGFPAQQPYPGAYPQQAYAAPKRGRTGLIIGLVIGGVMLVGIIGLVIAVNALSGGPDATGPWHAEWLALPQAFALGAGALHHTRALLTGLRVDAARMRRNLDATRGMITAEAVMMALAPGLGRDEAHHVVAAACGRALEQDGHLLDALCAEPRVAAHLSRAELERLLDPENYTGLCGAFVDLVVAQSRK